MNRPVTKYILDIERLALICDCNESKEMRIDRFLGGLKKELKETLEAIPNLILKVCAAVS